MKREEETGKVVKGIVMSEIKSVVALIFLGCMVSGLLGCAPRGETKSLDEVFQIAKQRYEQTIVSSKASSETKAQLLELVSDLNSFVQAESDSQVKALSVDISDRLSQLTATAGYTTRPALGEISKSFRGLAYPHDREQPIGVDGASEESVGNWTLEEPARKLLVARSFNTLAQELETTSFQIVKAGA